MSKHVAQTGCGLSREDFDNNEPCVDGGMPDEHPDEVKIDA